MKAGSLAIAGSAGLAILVGVAIAALRLLEPSPRAAGAADGPAAPAPPLQAAAEAGRPGPGSGPSGPSGPEPAEPSVPPPPPHQPAPPAVTQRGVVRPVAERPAAPGAAPWEAVETALRPAALGPDLAAPVWDGLAEARNGMQHCFDEEAKRLAHQPTASGRDPGASTGPAVLILRLEALAGRLSVAGVEVASTGTSSRQLVECCTRALVGFEFSAPAVKPPERYRVTMPLM